MSLVVHGPIRRLLLVLALAFVVLGIGGPVPAGGAHADEPKPPVKRRTPQGEAEAVLEAVRAGATDALRALAQYDRIDPWLVADELLRRGEPDAAAAFAKEVPGPDGEALPAHVQARRTRGSDEADRALAAEVDAAFAAKDLPKVLELTAALAPEVDVPLRVLHRHARSEALAGLGRKRESAVEARGAAEAALALGWLRRAALIYDMAVVLSLELPEPAQALAMLEVCQPLNERRGDKVYAARSLTQLGVVQAALGKTSEAGATYDEALARFEALGSKAGIHWVLANAVLLHQRVGAYAKEIAARERLQPLLDEKGDRGTAAENMNRIGTAYSDLRNHARALERLTDALARAQALGNKSAEAGVLVNLGNAHSGLGELAKALEHFERGRALAEQVGQREWQRNALVGVALVHMSSGQVAKALSTFQQLQALHERWGDKAGVAESMRRTADVHAARGDFAKAAAIYQRALESLEAQGDKAGACAVYQHLGMAFEALGDFARALSAQEQAVALWRESGNKAGESGALINVGNVYRSLGDSTSAMSYYERGLALAEEVGQLDWRTNALHNIAATHIDLGEPKRALECFERLLRSEDAQRVPLGLARTLSNMGKAYAVLKDLDKALELALKAHEMSEVAADPWMVAHTACDVACAHANRKDVEKALVFFEKSERVARSRRFAGLLAATQTHLAWLHLEREQPDVALRAARSALDEVEKLLGHLGEELGSSARSQHTGLYAVGALAALRVGDPAAVLTFLESGRAGALLDDLDRREALRWKAEALPPDLQLLDQEALARESVAREAYALAMQQEDRAMQRATSKALDEAGQGVRDVTGRIQRELKLKSAFFYPRARTLEEIQAALRPEQALVLYGLCGEEALALVLRAGSERVVSLGQAAEVVAACETLDVKRPGGDVTPAVELLRKRLVEPLGLKEDVRQVLVSPEGPLCYLPFALLFDATVAMTPSGTTHVLLQDEAGEAGHGILALGDPDYAGVSEGSKAIYHRGRTLSALPATRVEATRVGTTSLLGAQASEARLFEALQASPRWRAVHFACHGLVHIDKPMLSALALTRAGDGDGFLTALEVLRRPIPADLVVLSACETATGKIVSGEGIVGLTRAFMFAGSPRVICSLWKVDDEATQALMVRFYELWDPRALPGDPEQAQRVEGLPAAEALRKAQEHVRSQAKWKHPYYWAAWVLWGLP